VDLREYARGNILLLDGGMGTELQKLGAAPGQNLEALSVANPDMIFGVHKAYADAGADVILTNTFGANRLKLARTGLNPAEVIAAGVALAKRASEGRAFVALDVGPLGELLSPNGTLGFGEAYGLFAEQARLGAENGADAIFVETMTDLGEVRCAVLAAKENTDLPVFASMSFEADGRTFMGTPISAAALTLSGLGADFVGLNCSVGPAEAAAFAEEFARWTDTPVTVKPNAGLPRQLDGRTFYDATPEEFARNMERIARAGAAAVGGCCGTTPEYIARLAALIKGLKPARVPRTFPAAVCSALKTVVIDGPRMVGERINPTGKPRLREALAAGDADAAARVALLQIGAGADILDVNVSGAGIDERVMMAKVAAKLASVAPAPLMLDSSAAAALESGLRAYPGKAIINSVNGDAASLSSVLPLARKYGGAVIGLTLSAGGIPKTAAERVAIAARIVSACDEYGIPRRDIFIDCLTLTAGAEPGSSRETLAALRAVKERFGVGAALGVSNVSFGLPARGRLNQAFLTLALGAGLDLAIVNPNAPGTAETFSCHNLLMGRAGASEEYVALFGGAPKESPRELPESKSAPSLAECVSLGLRGEAAAAARRELETRGAMELIDDAVIPALNAVGERFERGEAFLPQLIAAAEAAELAFGEIRGRLSAAGAQKGEPIVLATVKGDIHDIGKNIVRTILGNYGYDVVDLGRDVPKEDVAAAVERTGARLVGLSALMTTTVRNMAETIAHLRSMCPGVKVMVGGAVLTEDYAAAIGADYYAKDAVAGVGIAEAALRTGGRK
jgi:5-methyltetrahydrofolate--homocysteine methyltransferase